MAQRRFRAYVDEDWRMPARTFLEEYTACTDWEWAAVAALD